MTSYSSLFFYLARQRQRTFDGLYFDDTFKTRDRGCWWPPTQRQWQLLPPFLIMASKTKTETVDGLFFLWCLQKQRWMQLMASNLMTVWKTKMTAFSFKLWQTKTEAVDSLYCSPHPQNWRQRLSSASNMHLTASIFNDALKNDERGSRWPIFYQMPLKSIQSPQTLRQRHLMVSFFDNILKNEDGDGLRYLFFLNSFWWDSLHYIFLLQLCYDVAFVPL